MTAGFRLVRARIFYLPKCTWTTKQPPTQQKDVGMHHSTFSFSKNKQLSGTYQNPKGVKVDEKFVVKVQGNTMMSPLLIYDKTRTCEFSLYPDEPGFSRILEEVHKEKAWQGRKTFMKASFDDNGCCTIYPHTAGVKDKYSW